MSDYIQLLEALAHQAKMPAEVKVANHIISCNLIVEIYTQVLTAKPEPF